MEEEDEEEGEVECRRLDSWSALDGSGPVVWTKQLLVVICVLHDSAAVSGRRRMVAAIADRFVLAFATRIHQIDIPRAVPGSIMAGIWTRQLL